jgi:hypothetical protein
MGQYHMVFNVTKKQFLHPHKFGEGLKLLEFGCSGCGTMTALAVLLSNSNGRGGGDLRSDDPLIGSWAGDRIVVCGDYAESGDVFGHVYGEANEDDTEWEDISEKIIAVLCEDRYIAQTLNANKERFG